jgi:phage-related protein
MKRVTFLGNSLEILQAFPDDVRRNAGHQLDRIQRGLDPNDWKPMTTIGAGVREMRFRDASGAYRVVYLAARSEAVYVLHAFQKKTEQTSARDLDLARSRFDELKRRE